MPPAKKNCGVCGEELYAMHVPRHMLGQHGIMPSGKPTASRGEDSRDSSVPGQSTEPRSDAGYESGQNSTTSQDDRTGVEAPPGAAEVAPRKPKLMDRLRGRRGRGRGGPTSVPASTGERPPKRPKRAVGRRVALDTDISDVWGFAGRQLEGGPHFATGRMLKYQAPAAGLILDRAVAGTLPDRILFQPIARNRDKYEDVGFLLAGPMLTFTITQTQARMQMLWDARAEWGEREAEVYQELERRLLVQREMFVWVLRMMLPRLAEGVKKAREKEEKENAAIAEAFPDLGSEDPVQVLVTNLFSPPNFQEASTNGTDPTTAHADREGSVPFGS